MLDEDSPLVSFFAAPSRQLQAGNQEEGAFSKKDMGVGRRLRVCLTNIRRYLVDVGRRMQMAGE